MQSSNPRPAIEYPTPVSLRQSLRESTSEIHARLHLHDGFAAIQNGTIDLGAYRSLLVRLYGFHVSFEAAVGGASDRSNWLLDDLAAVSLGGHTTPETIPRCTALKSFDTTAQQLGALYVVEGSTLGGRHLARHLDRLLGTTGSAGRRFFLGRGADTSAAWNAFLARLTSPAMTPAEQGEAVAAAVATFDIFQQWLQGWRDFAE